MTPAQYESLLAKQRGVCAICGNGELVLNSHSRTGEACRLGVDHDHRTGAVRGLLCRRCNAGVGQFRDNPKFLRRAAAYLSLYDLSEGVEVTD